MKKLISLILILCMACMLVPATAEEDLTGDFLVFPAGTDVSSIPGAVFETTLSGYDIYTCR